MRDSLRSLEEFCELWWWTVERLSCDPAAVKLAMMITAYRPDANIHLHRRFLHQLCNCGRVSSQGSAVGDALGIEMLLPSRTQVAQDLCLFRHMPLVSSQNGHARFRNRIHILTDATCSQARLSAKLAAAIDETVVSLGHTNTCSRVNTRAGEARTFSSAVRPCGISLTASTLLAHFWNATSMAFPHLDRVSSAV